MKLLVNGTVLTNDDPMVLAAGAVAMEADKIIAVGTKADLRALYPEAELIDARGGIIMPGMLNTHMHMYSAFARGMPLPGFRPRDFVGILEGLWWKLDKALTAEANYYSALISGIEAIQNGTTTLVDHHASPNAIAGSLDELARAGTELGIRCCLSYEVSDRDGQGSIRAGIAENQRFAQWCKHTKPELMAASFGLHASFTLSDQTLEMCAEAAGDTGIHIHTAEAASDRQHSLQHHGLPVAARLDKFGLWRQNSLAIHCVHIDSEEMALLKERGVNVIHNPESNMGNAVGRADVPTMLEMGLQVGLGTDGYTTDMFEGIKVANLLHKHDLGDPAAGIPVDKLAFSSNTEIVSALFGKKIGRLAPGWQADVIVLDYQPYTPLTAENWFGHVLMGMSGAQVRTTIVNGRTVLENRELKTIDKEKVYYQAKQCAQETWKQV
ncbi:MAG: putative aminohydrolase SsnA [Firmicutes bacterium]|nr:putative aminohydrolase SsnA [Bacillota bacterium]